MATKSNKILITLAGLAIAGAGAYFIFKGSGGGGFNEGNKSIGVAMVYCGADVTDFAAYEPIGSDFAGEITSLGVATESSDRAVLSYAGGSVGHIFTCFNPAHEFWDEMAENYQVMFLVGGNESWQFCATDGGCSNYWNDLRFTNVTSSPNTWLQEATQMGIKFYGVGGDNTLHLTLILSEIISELENGAMINNLNISRITERVRESLG